jgi:1-phosphatidylinositol phosphodiesterase
MPDNLTIRNFSNVPLELKVVERFDPHQRNGNPMANVTSVFAKATNSFGLTNNTTRAAVPQVDSNAHPFKTQDVSIRIDPFSVVRTDFPAFEHMDKERLRLTLEADDGRHQMYCPVPTQESADLIAPPNARRRLTGIYLTQSAFVALYSSSHLNSWMHELPNEIPLSYLSIPGTHNSPTHHLAPPSVRCQAASPWQQLQNGVRFFDLRVQPERAPDEPLLLVHAVFPISLAGRKYFRDLYNDILRFLRENPGETLIMSLKREGTGDSTDQQLSKIIKDHYVDHDRDAWYTEPRIPTLGEARGKIVLVRRFGLDDRLKGEHDGRGFGIDASSWPDNTPDSLCGSGHLRVQDFYEVMESENIGKKIEYCTAHFERSGCCVYDPQPLQQLQGQRYAETTPIFVNFLSASNFWKVGTWPEKIAAKVNPACVEWLCRSHMLDGDRPKEGAWGTGVVVCDWVGLDGDWDLVRCIVGMNAKLIAH